MPCGRSRTMKDDVDPDLQRAKLEEDSRERKREMWMWFCGLMVTVVAITILLVVLIGWLDHRNRQENITKRERIQACAGIETETARVVCVNGWGS